MKAGNQILKSKGNQAQYDSNVSVINDLAKSLTAFEENRPADLESSIRSGIISLNGRNKLIKLADNSAVGWAFVDEYLRVDGAVDEEDDRHIRRCEAAAVEKRRLRQEASSRGRGGKAGRGRQFYDHPNNRRRYPQNTGPYEYNSGGEREFHGSQTQRNEEYGQYAPDTYRPHYQRHAEAGPSRGGHYYQAGYQRPLGPCYKCGGPHLIRNCPRNQQETADVQYQIEEEYYN